MYRRAKSNIRSYVEIQVDEHCLPNTKTIYFGSDFANMINKL